MNNLELLEKKVDSIMNMHPTVERMKDALWGKKEYQLYSSGVYSVNNLEEVSKVQERSNLMKNIEFALDDIISRNEFYSSKKQDNAYIDMDWIARWRREAKVIGKEELQRIWARVLAEEITEPGKVSYRTLSVVSNITSSDAEIFNRISRFALNGMMFCLNYEKKTSPTPFSYEDCEQLVDAGLLISVFEIISEGKGNEGNELIRRADGYGFYIVAETTSCESMPFIGYSLTKAGRELLNISDVEYPSIDEIRYMFQLCVNQCTQLTTVKRLAAYGIDPYDRSCSHLLFEAIFEKKN